MGGETASFPRLRLRERSLRWRQRWASGLGDAAEIILRDRPRRPPSSSASAPASAGPALRVEGPEGAGRGRRRLRRSQPPRRPTALDLHLASFPRAPPSESVPLLFTPPLRHPPTPPPHPRYSRRPHFSPRPLDPPPQAGRASAAQFRLGGCPETRCSPQAPSCRGRLHH